MLDAVKHKKPVKFDLTTVDSNAFMLMGCWQRQAKKEGWTSEECLVVLEECKKGDYDHLVQTLITHCK